jgi:hypothetical protein
MSFDKEQAIIDLKHAKQFIHNIHKEPIDAVRINARHGEARIDQVIMKIGADLLQDTDRKAENAALREALRELVEATSRSQRLRGFHFVELMGPMEKAQALLERGE